MHFRKSASLVLAAAITAALPVLPGCGPQLGGYDYNASEARQSHSVYKATVTEVREVAINSGTSSNQTAGGLIGAIAGGVIGSTIGSGSGRTLATVGGAEQVFGGSEERRGGAEWRSRRPPSHQYENGSEEVIVQGKEPYITPGQRVRIVVGANGNRRVEPEY